MFANPGGTITMVYASGHQQTAYSFLANYAEFRETALAVAGVQEVSASLGGLLTIESSSGVIQAQPDFAVRSASASLQRTSFLSQPDVSLVVRYRDGREQAMHLFP